MSLNARIALERRLIQSSGNGGESHELAHLSIAGEGFPRAQARGGKVASPSVSRMQYSLPLLHMAEAASFLMLQFARGAGSNGIQVTTQCVISLEKTDGIGLFDQPDIPM